MSDWLDKFIELTGFQKREFTDEKELNARVMQLRSLI
ncbi:hypothetical protein AVEN_40306-1, partial [Araneus ventricosus]